MMKSIVFLVAGLLLVPTLASAAGAELTAFGGYNLGGSIDVREDAAYKLNSADSFSTGLSLGWQKSPTHTFELYWGWRPTDIEGNDLEGNPQKIVSLNAHDFHANFLFSPAYSEKPAVPFLLLGLGATLLDPGEVQGLSPDSEVRFSWALGAGFKTVGSKGVGFRAQVRYHSTYVSDEANGTWCDPYYGCYTAVESNWLDEWDFQGGLVFQPGRK